jgi:error-prone DNA polymerase
MGFYPPDALLREAQRRDVRSAPVDVNASAVLCRTEWLDGELAVRIGLGYVKGVKGTEMEALVAARERGGPYAGVTDLAARSGVGRDGLERLAWAGALDGLPAGEGRREGSWKLGVLAASRRGGDQLSLPFESPPAPALEPLGPWQRIVEDYRSTGVNLGEHPLSLLRDGLGEDVSRSTDLEGIGDGAEVEVAGMAIARQRPETAKGITFILLEDERGTVNLVVPSGVYARRREVVRSAPLIQARGRLERREGVVNVLVADLEALRWSGPAPPPASRIEPAAAEPEPETEAGGDDLTARRRARELAVAELRAVMPAGHSFGRRGR